MKIDMQNWMKNLKRILWEDSFDAVELFGAVNAFGWGFWFISHPNIFDLGSVYAMLAAFADAYVWGFGLVFLGLLKLFGILSDRYFVRKWLALLATFCWAFMFLSFWQTNSSSILVWITGEVAIYSIWEFFRHARRQHIRREIREEIKRGNIV